MMFPVRRRPPVRRFPRYAEQSAAPNRKRDVSCSA
jgi:hypothetical protein